MGAGVNGRGTRANGPQPAHKSRYDRVGVSSSGGLCDHHCPCSFGNAATSTEHPKDERSDCTPLLSCVKRLWNCPNEPLHREWADKIHTPKPPFHQVIIRTGIQSYTWNNLPEYVSVSIQPVSPVLHNAILCCRIAYFNHPRLTIIAQYFFQTKFRSYLWTLKQSIIRSDNVPSYNPK